MANIIYDPGVRTISGAVGGIVHRRQKDGTWSVAKPPLKDPDRIPTAAQVTHLQRFRVASAHCRNLMENAALKATYRMILGGHGRRLRALMIRDILIPPTIETIDLSHYKGAVGDTIRVLAGDNVAIARLTLVIHDNTSGEDLEAGEKLMGSTITEFVEWLYVTTAALPDPSLNHLVDIKVTAYDLAGNETSSVVSATP